jgi:succinate-semialdehyde dehydrogenase / glutarate-semialdehyde dehydrogenase
VLKEPGGPGGGLHALELPHQPGGAQAVGALATGCSIIVKAPEETPASPAELVRPSSMPACRPA